MIDLRNDINKNEIPENENQKKVVKIHEKILDKEKVKQEKKKTRKEMIQRLPVATCTSKSW